MSELSNESAIIVEKLYKSFKLPREHGNGIKQVLINYLKGKKGYEMQHVLKDVSFDIKKGEFFGIVGRNGSGKSTLLKLIAEIYASDKGSVKVNGSLTPFIELGVGFNPELTGRENVFLNGALLGFNKKEIAEKYDDIVNFSEMHRFMDQKLKNYSSGMQVRLAFSIAIQAKSDILLLDEILAVGDEAFQRKCIDYFYNIKKSGQTVILVTHDMSNVEKFCDRVLVLNAGKMLGVYTPPKAKMVYEQLNREQDKLNSDQIEIGKEWGTKEVTLKSLTLNGSSKIRHFLPQAEPFSIEFTPQSKDKKELIIGLAIYDQSGLVLAGPNSQGKKFYSNQKIVYSVPKNPLTPGDYMLRVAIFAEDHRTEYYHREEALKITVTSEGNQVHGKVNLFGSWKSLKEDEDGSKK